MGSQWLIKTFLAEALLCAVGSLMLWVCPCDWGLSPQLLSTSPGLVGYTHSDTLSHTHRGRDTHIGLWRVWISRQHQLRYPLTGQWQNPLSYLTLTVMDCVGLLVCVCVCVCVCLSVCEDALLSNWSICIWWSICRQMVTRIGHFLCMCVFRENLGISQQDDITAYTNLSCEYYLFALANTDTIMQEQTVGLFTYLLLCCACAL